MPAKGALPLYYSAATARSLVPGVGFPPLSGCRAPVDWLNAKDSSPEAVLTNRCAPSAEKATFPVVLATLTGEPTAVTCPEELTAKMAMLLGWVFATAIHGPLLATPPAWPPVDAVPLVCWELLAIGLAFTVPALRSVQMRYALSAVIARSTPVPLGCAGLFCPAVLVSSVPSE